MSQQILIKPCVLILQKEIYENYLSYLFKNSQSLFPDNHLIYLQKIVFDAILENFNQKKLKILQQKQDAYLHYIIYSTFYNSRRISENEFLIIVQELTQYFCLNNDEILFVQQIQLVVKSALAQKNSPFTYLEIYKQFFSQRLQTKLNNILKYMIGGSLCYKMSPASIFGLCLNWTVKNYRITNSKVNEIINHLIDQLNNDILNKNAKLEEIMKELIQNTSNQ